MPESTKVGTWIYERGSTTGGTGTGVIKPPDVTAILTSITGRITSHDTAAVFNGRIDLPVALGNWDHVDVELVYPPTVKRGVSVLIGRYFRPEGGASFIDYTGLSDDRILLGEDAVEDCILRFTSFSKEDISGPNPFDIPLTLPALSIGTVTGREYTVDRWQDEPDRNVHSVVTATATVTTQNAPFYCTVWTNHPADSVMPERIWHGWHRSDQIRIGGEGANTNLFTPLKDEQWTITVERGTIDASVAPTQGAVTSLPFSVVKVQPPSPGMIAPADVKVPPGVGGTFPYDRVWADGSHDWYLEYVRVDTTRAYPGSAGQLGVNTWYIQLVLYDFNGAFAFPFGPPHPFKDELPINGVQHFGDLGGPYGEGGAGFDIQVYAINRVAPQPGLKPWEDPAVATKQCELRVIVAQGGASPPTGGGIQKPPPVTADVYQPTGEPWGSGVAAVFDGSIHLPTLHPDYALLHHVDVEFRYPGTPASTAILRTYEVPATGSEIPFHIVDGRIQLQPQPIANCYLRFTGFTEADVPSEPYDIQITLPGKTQTIPGGPAATATAVDASTLPTSDPRYRERWKDDGGALRMVVAVTVNFPQAQNVTLLLNKGGADLWQKSVSIPAGATTVYLGERGDWNTAVYPPTDFPQEWSVLVAPGNLLDGEDTSRSGAIRTSRFTVNPPPEPTNDVVGSVGAGVAVSYIDWIIYGDGPKAGKYGWGHLYSVLPFTHEDEFFFARWTIQTGHYQTPGNPATFVGGGQHPEEMAFTDDDDSSVHRIPRSNRVYIENDLLWDVPDKYLAPTPQDPLGTTLNPDNIVRFKQYIGSRYDPYGFGGTLTQQNVWSAGVGQTTPAQRPYFDVVLDLDHSLLKGPILNPSTRIPGVTIPLDPNRPHRITNGNLDLKTDEGEGVDVHTDGGASGLMRGHLRVRRGAGQAAAGRDLTLNLGEGQTFKGPLLEVNASDGLIKTGGPLKFLPGPGMEIDVNKKGAIKIGRGQVFVSGTDALEPLTGVASGTEFGADGAIQVKVDGAAGIKRGATEGIQVKIGANAGTKVQSDGIAVRVARGTVLYNGDIDVKVNGGLGVDASGVAVGLSDGIMYPSGDSTRIKIRLGGVSGMGLDSNGIVVGSGNGIAVDTGAIRFKPDTGGPLTVGANGATITIGIGITGTTSIRVDQGAGLTTSGNQIIFSSDETTLERGPTVKVKGDSLTDTQIKSLNFSKLTVGEMTVTGATPVKFTGTGGVQLTGGGNFETLAGWVTSNSGYGSGPFATYKLGAYTMVDSSLNANFLSVKIQNTETINSSRDGYFRYIYRNGTELDSLYQPKGNYQPAGSYAQEYTSVQFVQTTSTAMCRAQSFGIFQVADGKSGTIIDRDGRSVTFTNGIVTYIGEIPLREREGEETPNADRPRHSAGRGLEHRAVHRHADPRHQRSGYRRSSHDQALSDTRRLYRRRRSPNHSPSRKAVPAAITPRTVGSGAEDRERD
jgi:hypothetical protein